MKKIICLLLILTCSFALFACGGETAVNGDNEGGVENQPNAPENGAGEGDVAAKPENGGSVSGGLNGDLGAGDGSDNSFVAGGGTTVSADDLFFRMIAASNPNKITTVAYTTHTATGEVYEGRYVTTIYSENSINYYYKTETKAIVTPDEVYEGSKKVSEGTIEYVDGSFFHVDAEGNKTTATAMPNVDVLGADFKLEKQLLGKYRLTPDGKTLSTNLTADQAAQVLGVDIEANGNVTVRIETNGTYLAKVTVTYSNDVASVSIETSYTYEVLK